LNSFLYADHRLLTHLSGSSFAELSLQFDDRAFYLVIADRDSLCHHDFPDTIPFTLLFFRLFDPQASLVILHRLSPCSYLAWKLENEIVHIEFHVTVKLSHYSFNLASRVESIEVLGQMLMLVSVDDCLKYHWFASTSELLFYCL